MASLREKLEALWLKHRDRTLSNVDETNPLTGKSGMGLTNLLLLELLQKQREQMQQ